MSIMKMGVLAVISLSTVTVLLTAVASVLKTGKKFFEKGLNRKICKAYSILEVNNFLFFYEGCHYEGN